MKLFNKLAISTKIIAYPKTATYFFQIVRFRKILAHRPFTACIASIRTSYGAFLFWFDGVRLSATMICLTTSIIIRVARPSQSTAISTLDVILNGPAYAATLN